MLRTNIFVGEEHQQRRNEFEVDIATGLILNSKSHSKFEGKVIVFGNETPISIISEKKVLGKKL